MISYKLIRYLKENGIAQTCVLIPLLKRKNVLVCYEGSYHRLYLPFGTIFNKTNEAYSVIKNIHVAEVIPEQWWTSNLGQKTMVSIPNNKLFIH